MVAPAHPMAFFPPGLRQPPPSHVPSACWVPGHGPREGLRVCGQRVSAVGSGGAAAAAGNPCVYCARPAALPAAHTPPRLVGGRCFGGCPLLSVVSAAGHCLRGRLPTRVIPASPARGHWGRPPTCRAPGQTPCRQIDAACAAAPVQKRTQQKPPARPPQPPAALRLCGWVRAWGARPSEQQVGEPAMQLSWCVGRRAGAGRLALRHVRARAGVCLGQPGVLRSGCLHVGVT